MPRSTGIARLVALALVATVGSALLVPLCSMPACGDSGAVVCADFQPACDDCPSDVVMKHERDDAVSVHAPAPPELIAAPVVAEVTGDVLVASCFGEPTPTASPPPLDPLGVRLLV